MKFTARAKLTAVIGLTVALPVAIIAVFVLWTPHGQKPSLAEKIVSFAMRKSLFHLTRRDAEKGIAQDQYNVGYYYSIGLGVEVNQVEAVKWYRKAAEQNYARAQAKLGRYYQTGEVVGNDYAEAYAWYELGATPAKRETGHEAFSYSNERADLHRQMSPEQIIAGKKRLEELQTQIAAKLKSNGK